MARILLERGPQTDDELWYVVKAFWGVTIPRHTCGDPNHTAPFEAFANAYFEKDGSIALWHGSRGLSGKSFLISILGITKAFFRGTDVNLLGGSLAQSTNIHQHMRAALEHKNAPREMITTEAQYLIRLSNRARIVPLTASQKTVRGPHPPFLLLDEIDEMHIDILNAALGQPLPQKNWAGELLRPYTVMVSTWQNAGGTFETKYREFQEKGLPIYTWCYKCSANPIDGWLAQETIDAKKREIPAEMWRVEYELGEPSIGNRAFDTDAVDAVFSLPFAPIERKEQKDFEYYVFEKPQPKGVYIVGADWGKDQDYTVIWTLRIDKQPFTLAHYIRVNRRPYPVMIKMFNDVIAEYSAEAIHDATGVGNAVNDYVDIRAQKFIMTGDKRSGMLTEYVAAVERKVFAFPRIPSAYSEMKYCRVGDLYEKGGPNDYHLPDTICAAALAWRSGKKWNTGPGDPVVVPKSTTPHRYEKHFQFKMDDELFSGFEQHGEVKRVTAEPTSSYNFLV